MNFKNSTFSFVATTVLFSSAAQANEIRMYDEVCLHKELAICSLGSTTGLSGPTAHYPEALYSLKNKKMKKKIRKRVEKFVHNTRSKYVPGSYAGTSANRPECTAVLKSLGYCVVNIKIPSIEEMKAANDTLLNAWLTSREAATADK